LPQELVGILLTEIKILVILPAESTQNRPESILMIRIFCEGNRMENGPKGILSYPNIYRNGD